MMLFRVLMAAAADMLLIAAAIVDDEATSYADTLMPLRHAAAAFADACCFRSLLIAAIRYAAMLMPLLRCFSYFSPHFSSLSLPPLFHELLTRQYFRRYFAMPFRRYAFRYR